jgi:hypothetical protein
MVLNYLRYDRGPGQSRPLLHRLVTVGGPIWIRDERAEVSVIMAGLAGLR